MKFCCKLLVVRINGHGALSAPLLDAMTHPANYSDMTNQLGQMHTVDDGRLGPYKPARRVSKSG